MKSCQSYRGSLATAIMMPLLAFSITQAQSADHQKTEPTLVESKSQGYDLEINEGVIVRGGTRPGKATASLANVIDAIRDRYPEANIVLAPGLANLTISDLKLRTGSIWEELEAIRVASGGKFEWSGPNSPIFGRPGSPSPSMFGTAPGPVDPTTGLPTAGGSNNRGLFTLHEPWPTPETERVVEAFNIGGYLETLAGREHPKDEPASGKESQEPQARQMAQESLAQIKEIITQAIAALHPEHVADSPRFQFHRGANLLVVIGSRNEVDVARKVINALLGQPQIPPVGTGNSLPETRMTSAEREAFMRRYGLVRPSLPAPNTPQYDEQFRRRYGLKPNQPPSKDEPDYKPQP